MLISAGQVDPRTARELESLRECGWRVSHERDLHHLAGPPGSYVVRTNVPPASVQAGVQPVAVLWNRFPLEVAELGGVFFVHGDHLVTFLRAQPHLLHPDAFQQYEIADQDR